MPETFGQRLKRIRTEKGFSQMELAEEAGVAQCQICSYEKDRHSPTITIFEWICKTLNVTASELLGY